MTCRATRLGVAMSTDIEEVGTPLRVFLSIYQKAQLECYCNYMEGAKALAKFLHPIIFPVCLNTKLPKIFRTYEISELAIILDSCTESDMALVLDSRRIIENAIYYSTCNELS